MINKMSNKMKEVAKLIGVDFYEDFYILEYGTANTYSVCNDGLYNHRGELCSEFLVDLLAGYGKIQKLPWKPKTGDGYYFVTTCGVVYSTINISHDIDKRRILFGNCFKTDDEAIKMANKFKELLKMGVSDNE